MSVVGAILLLFGGLAGVAAAWNAAKPVLDPTRRYSPAWLPAMVFTELAPFWAAVHVAVVTTGILLGGLDNWGGRIGAGLLAVSVALLVWTMVRTWLGVRRLRRRVDRDVPPPRGLGRLVGRPVPAPHGVVERHAVDWYGGLTLDIVRPAEPAGAGPVLVYVHGGGWTGGDPQRQGRDLYHALAVDGWTTLAVRYPFTPQVSVEQQIEVVRSAVAWARVELPDRDGGVVPTDVALAGGSAGAHLATMAALTARRAEERVAACVGIYGVYDMANRNRTRAPWTKIHREVMLASVDEAPDRYRAVSPIDRVRADSPPMLLVHGTHDTLVPFGEATQFVEALRAANRPVELVPVHGAQHAFDAISSITSRTVAAVVRDWLRRTVVDAAEPSRRSPGP